MGSTILAGLRLVKNWYGLKLAYTFANNIFEVLIANMEGAVMRLVAVACKDVHFFGSGDILR